MRKRCTHIKLAPSFVVVVCMAGIALFNSHKYSPWNDSIVIRHDVNYLYSYLPAYFIYDDMTYEYRLTADSVVQQKTWLLEAENGGLVSKMTCGAAILCAPGFLVAHFLALNSDIPANGYSWIYEYGIAMSAILYVFIGLLLLRSFLKNYFTEWVIALTMVGVFLGTNLYYYTVHESGMTHAYSFFLFAWCLWLTHRWYNTFRWHTAILLGVAIGLIVLVRPTNGLIAIIPLLYGGLSGKAEMLKKHWPKIIYAAFACLLVLFPQLLYWKSHTNEWLHFSYHNEGFFFAKPHILDGLFSYRKGLFIYTPIMVFSFLGIWFFRKKSPQFFWPIVVFTILNLYVVFCWWCWWYGGSFGMRALIESYAIWTIPLAASIDVLTQQRAWKKVVVTLGVLLFCYINTTQTKQYLATLIHWDSMTKEAYWAVFLEEQFPENYSELIKTPDYEAAMEGVSEKE